MYVHDALLHLLLPTTITCLLQVTNHQPSTIAKVAKCVDYTGTHVTETYEPGQFEQYMAYVETPSRPPPSADIRRAVVLDAEMGTNAWRGRELIGFTLSDCCTGETLLDDLVCPTDTRMSSWDTRWSGISWPMAKRARADGTAVHGRAAARARIWKHVGPATYVVVHGGSNDMDALRWIHPRDADTQRVGPWGGRGLRNSAAEFLGMAIQAGRPSSAEDVDATRELCRYKVTRAVGGGAAGAEVGVGLAPAVAPRPDADGEQTPICVQSTDAQRAARIAAQQARPQQPPQPGSSWARIAAGAPAARSRDAGAAAVVVDMRRTAAAPIRNDSLLSEEERARFRAR